MSTYRYVHVHNTTIVEFLQKEKAVILHVSITNPVVLAHLIKIAKTDLLSQQVDLQLEPTMTTFIPPAD